MTRAACYRGDIEITSTHNILLHARHHIRLSLIMRQRARRGLTSQCTLRAHGLRRRFREFLLHKIFMGLVRRMETRMAAEEIGPQA